MNENTAPIFSPEVTPAQVSFDEQALRSWASRVVDPWLEKEVTEEEVPEIKKAMAELNRQADSINATWREKVKEAGVQITTASETVKVVVAEILAAREKLDLQVKAFEAADRKRRESDILQIIEKHKKDLDVDIVIEIDPRWLNRTATRKGVSADVIAIISKSKQAAADQAAAKQARQDRVAMVEKQVAWHEKNHKFGWGVSTFEAFLDLSTPLQDALDGIPKAYTEEALRRQEAESDKAILRPKGAAFENVAPQKEAKKTVAFRFDYDSDQRDSVVLAISTLRGQGVIVTKIDMEEVSGV